MNLDNKIESLLQEIKNILSPQAVRDALAEFDNYDDEYIKSPNDMNYKNPQIMAYDLEKVPRDYSANQDELREKEVPELTDANDSYDMFDRRKKDLILVTFDKSKSPGSARTKFLKYFLWRNVFDLLERNLEWITIMTNDESSDFIVRIQSLQSRIDSSLKLELFGDKLISAKQAIVKMYQNILVFVNEMLFGIERFEDINFIRMHKKGVLRKINGKGLAQALKIDGFIGEEDKLAFEQLFSTYEKRVSSKILWTKEPKKLAYLLHILVNEGVLPSGGQLWAGFLVECFILPKSIKPNTLSGYASKASKAFEKGQKETETPGGDYDDMNDLVLSYL